MPPMRHEKSSCSPRPSRSNPIAFISIKQEESQHLRSYQTPQFPVTPTHHLTLTPATTPSPASASRMGRLSKPKTATPKERILKIEEPQEKVNYPPHWPLSAVNHERIMAMDLYPKDDIRLYTRRIPFKGAKEYFLKKTGRNRFDVYEYRFTASDTYGCRKTWWIMWDYYNGLVRVHDFFDCCKPGKTEPGNAVKDKVNPGLCEVSHNITGGNLHAQGYWLPYDAAKALAAKFCYRIRFALTILFGEDFPDLCLPDMHEDFGRFEIDQNIIAECQSKAREQFKIEQKRLLESSQSPLLSSGYTTPVLGFQKGFPVGETPKKEPRFFDPVRNDYTSGGSLRSERLSPWNSLRESNSPITGIDRNEAKFLSNDPRIESSVSVKQKALENDNNPNSKSVMKRYDPFENLRNQSHRDQRTEACIAQTRINYQRRSASPENEGTKFRIVDIPRLSSPTVVQGTVRGPLTDGIEMAKNSKRQKTTSLPYVSPRYDDSVHNIPTARSHKTTDGLLSEHPFHNQLGSPFVLVRNRAVTDRRLDRSEDAETLHAVEAACSLVSLGIADYELGARNKNRLNTWNILSEYPSRRCSV